MSRLVLLIAVAVLIFCSIGARPALAQPLPAIDANGVMTPLTEDQLDPEERADFAKLAPGSDDARQFLFTRGYLRYCRLVATGALPPLQLPDLPARDDWDRQFLSQVEARDVVDVALGMNLVAKMQPAAFRALGPRPAPAPDFPAVDADGMTAALAEDQLDPEERVSFAKLAPGSDDARIFLYTRGYFRYCRLVADGKLPPLELPNLPAVENWDRKFLSGEEAGVVDLALGKKLIATMTPPAN